MAQNHITEAKQAVQAVSSFDHENPNGATSANLPRSAIGQARPFLCSRQSVVAALLLPFLGLLTSVPYAAGQQTTPASSPNATGTAAAGASPQQKQPSSEKPAPLPPISQRQSAMARDFFRRGTRALHAHKSSEALQLLSQAHDLDPANVPYLAAYEIARQQIVSIMMHSAAAETKAGNTAQAAGQLKQALKVDPNNPFVREHLESLAMREPAVAESTPMPEFSSGVVELAPSVARASFHFTGNAQQVIQRVFQAYGVNTIVDDSVPTQNVRLELTNASFSEASTAVQLTTHTFVVPLDPQRALVAKDTKENRAKFERLLLETVFLPGLSAKEMADPVNLVKNVFQVKQASARPNNGTLTIRAPESTLRAINATLGQLYVEKPEVILDVKIYQVNDNRQETLGVAFPQTFSVFNMDSQLQSIIASNQSTIQQLVSSGLVNPSDLAGIAALLVGLGLVQGTVLNQPFALFGNGLTLSGLSFGATTGNASLSIANTREIDHIQLRVGGSKEETFLVGSRYPIITQSYSAGTQTPTAATSLAGLIGGAGAAGTQLSGVNPLATAPTVTYQDLGFTMKAGVTVHQGDRIDLKLKIKIAALAGSSINGDPIINNQSFTTAVQVHDGGTAMMVSSVSQQEVRSLSGIPGLSELPGFAWTASPNTQLIVGDLLILVTPRIVSGLPSNSVATKMLYLPPQS